MAKNKQKHTKNQENIAKNCQKLPKIATACSILLSITSFYKPFTAISQIYTFPSKIGETQVKNDQKLQNKYKKNAQMSQIGLI